ncbi:hypothetical protein CDCA_CDCA08G2398 [Cyanidium caldarium]|uniref:Fatty acid hydroxylase domain-containing protein n=1 Tax=Cyanidium caldarium TaxID=2771 RepID=A0AAV9IX43_CYACA|nr:hypothetical protein CDCA_CDCA08G2398 [Cyanidium caldarium]
MHPSEVIANFCATRHVPLSLVCFICHAVVFHGGCALFALLDRKRWLQRYKELKGDQLKYRDMIGCVLRNQLLLLLPPMLLCERLGWAFVYREADGTVRQEGVFQYAVNAMWMTLGHDLFFYVGHRFVLHSPQGFKFFQHDMHHSTKASVALSSMYMAPCDYMLEICVPYLVPLCLLRADPLFNLAAITFGGIGGMYEHSGYNFCPQVPGLSTMAHGMHHTRYNCSFSDGVGSSNLMDNMFRTDYEHMYPKWAGKKSFRSATASG